MPIYQYYNVANEDEKRDFIFSMKDDKPEVLEADGIQWKRDWSSIRVQAKIDGKLSCWAINKWTEKTGRMKGKMGDLMDLSAELSERRAHETGGVDPVKEKVFENYAKTHRGHKHPDIIKKNLEREITVGDTGIE